jgi:isoquinoline 1-oxidoreductase beta subunit
MTGRITTPSPEPEPVAAGSLDRRGFLKILTAGSSALVIGAWLPPVANPPHRSGRGEGFHPSPLIEITPDNMVTVIVKHLEMGQGVETGLASLVAEELDAGHDQVRTRFAPVDPMRYGNLLAFGMQATLASTSMANSYLQYRHAGAIARASGRRPPPAGACPPGA